MINNNNNRNSVTSSGTSTGTGMGTSTRGNRVAISLWITVASAALVEWVARISHSPGD